MLLEHSFLVLVNSSIKLVDLTYTVFKLRLLGYTLDIS